MADNKYVHGEPGTDIPDPPHDVSSTGPDGPQQDWDATSDATREGWKAVDSGSGRADLTGHVVASFEDGPGRWKQT